MSTAASGHRAPPRFERARQVADAVLYEGYVLYPYRASARKNHVRWQFGVLAPRDWSRAGGCEEWWSETECLIEGDADTRLVGTTRFLQVRTRRVEAAEDGGRRFRAVPSLEADGRLWTSWEEGVEREVEFEVAPCGARAQEHERRFSFPGTSETESIPTEAGAPVGRVVREQRLLAGVLRISSERIGAPAPLYKLRLRVENRTPWHAPGAPREETLSSFFVAVHTLLAVRAGSFLSLTDPPAWASAAAAGCRNRRAWPVLVGERGSRDVVLSSPIILEDYPEIAPESPGDLYDATEIDEILTLRTMTLSDEEKREARATDPRAAAIIDRVDGLPPAVLDRLHGAIRYLRDAAPPPEESRPAWWDPAAEASVDPETASIEVDGTTIAKGSRVRLRPRTRGGDVQDRFLAGRAAVVQGVFLDVDDGRHLAVVLEGDPAADLHQWHGRFFYFAPDEVEPIAGRE